MSGKHSTKHAHPHHADAPSGGKHASPSKHSHDNGGRGGGGKHSPKGGGGGRGSGGGRHHGRDGGSQYAEHLSEAELSEGMANGSIYLGTLKVFPQKRKVAYVKIEGESVDIVIENEKMRNRAHVDSEVYVQLLPESEWNTQWRERRMSSGHKDESKPAADFGPEGLWNVRQELLVPRGTAVAKAAAAAIAKVEAPSALFDAARSTGHQPAGKVVGIKKAGAKTSLTGSLKAQCAVEENKALPRGTVVFFLPSDKRYGDMVIPGTELPDAYMKNPFAGQKRIYVADIDHWSISSKCAFGSNVRDIGAIGSIYSETEAILIELGLNHTPYGDEEILKGVLSDETGDLSGWTIPEEEIAKRRDLRSTRIFTVDPYNARDLDDALHITELSDGTFEVGVHIADVSFFVKEGIPLDVEAHHRGTSIYLVQKVIPMLPPILCEELCSLNPNVDRLAFSCIWRMKVDGELCKDTPIWFGKSVIRSCAKLDYATAQRMVDGIIPSDPSDRSEIAEDIWEFLRRPGAAVGSTSGDDGIPTHNNWEVARDVVLLHRVAMARRVQRFRNGALALGHPKIVFGLDAAGNPESFSTYPIRETNNMVEEYMLLANYYVAQELVAKSKDSAFLRRHRAPDVNNNRKEDIKAVTDLLNVNLGAIDSVHEIQETLATVLAASDPETQHIVEILFTRIMILAEYFVVGDSEADIWRHFALGIPYYTHFTSPIRRYADIAVHRLLFAAISTDSAIVADGTTVKKLTTTADWCNHRKKDAKSASEKCDTMFLAVYLMSHACEEVATVIGMGASSFTVLVPRLGIESRIFTNDMKEVSTHYDEVNNSLTFVPRVLSSGDAAADASEVDERVGRMENFDQMQITLLTKLRVYLYASTNPGLDVKVSVVGPML
jgi:DIS3-like exonuclease 2